MPNPGARLIGAVVSQKKNSFFIDLVVLEIDTKCGVGLGEVGSVEILELFVRTRGERDQR